MDPRGQFGPNPACWAYGRAGEGPTVIHPALARQSCARRGATHTVDMVGALVVAEPLRAFPNLILTSDPNDIRLLVGGNRAHPRVWAVLV